MTSQATALKFTQTPLNRVGITRLERCLILSNTCQHCCATVYIQVYFFLKKSKKKLHFVTATPASVQDEVNHGQLI